MNKTEDYVKILSDIALERELPDLAKYILSYKETLGSIQKEYLANAKYNITTMPEAHCDGCE